MCSSYTATFALAWLDESPRSISPTEKEVNAAIAAVAAVARIIHTTLSNLNIDLVNFTMNGSSAFRHALLFFVPWLMLLFYRCKDLFIQFFIHD